MITYLCGGINGLTDAEATDWRTLAKKLLKTDILDPIRRDYRGREDDHSKEIVEGDLADIKASDFILVNASRPSFGTAMEIVYAHQMGKKIYTVVPGHPISPWLVYHSSKLSSSFEEAVNLINKVAGGEPSTLGFFGKRLLAVKLYYKYKFSWKCAYWLTEQEDLLKAYESAVERKDLEAVAHLHTRMIWPVGRGGR